MITAYIRYTKKKSEHNFVSLTPAWRETEEAKTKTGDFKAMCTFLADDATALAVYCKRILQILTFNMTGTSANFGFSSYSVVRRHNLLAGDHFPGK